MLDDPEGVPGQRGYVGGHITILGVVAVDKVLCRTGGALGRIVGAEEQAVAILATQLDRIGRAPAIAAHDGCIPSQLVRLLYDQGYLVVVLWREKELGACILDLGQLRAKVGVARRKALKGHHRACTVDSLPTLLKVVGESFRVVAGNVIEHTGLGEAELV